MNDILTYYARLLALSTLTLKKKGILVEKPWALIDEDGEIQKLIFKRDKGLIISKNGKVIEGAWDYFPDAKALLIDRISDKLLLKEQYIDENVLIFKRDGTENHFYAFANENSIPDYNVGKYLNSLKCLKLNIREEKLLSGNILQIPIAKDYKRLNGIIVEQRNNDYNCFSISDGRYLTQNKRLTFYIEKNVIRNVVNNLIVHFKDDTVTIEIEDGDEWHSKNNIGKYVTKNGEEIANARLISLYNKIYEIKESYITNIKFLRTYELSNGYKIDIEQRDQDKIKRGDRITSSDHTYPIPDGSYKIKGRLFKINVKNNEII